MSLLHRTIKLMLATCLAAWLAKTLGLAYSVSAGIIALLSVSDTRRSTARLARDRFLSTILALTIGSLAFRFLGFNLGALALYIAIYVPLAFQLGWEIGITPSTVLVSYHEQVEEQLKKILLRFEYFLKSGDGRNDATLIKELDKTLEQALNLVYLDRSNHLFHQTNYHIHYFEMRRAQNRILLDMAGNINTCRLAASESFILAKLFLKTAKQLSQENPGHDLLDEIEEYLAVFRKRPLPKTRQEFETRATLLQLLRNLETFIELKVDFYRNYQEERN